MSKIIYWFREIGKEDVSVAGGKGANLGEMFRAGFPIPPGFVIGSNAYFDFLKITGLKSKIEELLKGLDVNDTAQLQKVAEQIQRMIEEGKMPESMRDEIIRAYEKLAKELGEEPLVAVRSSATAEDLPKASFAGQQATFLNVNKEGLVKAVKKCWASLFTARAIFYREKQGFDHMKVGIAVVVQKMVESEASGVVFTTHPTGERNVVIIEAVYGLGEGIVSGRYTPDHYEVEPGTWNILKKDVAVQKKMIVFDREKGENVEVDVPPEKQAVQKIPDHVIVELAKVSKKIEEHYAWPQDIEWAYEKGHLYIVQSRPVTTLQQREKDREEAKSVRLKPLLRGLGASPGVAAGPVKIIKKVEEIDKVKEGDVLVTKMTNPDMVPAMQRAVAIVTDEGGMTSHAAIVSRELGIPCVVGTKNATKVLKEGMTITVDGKRGLVYEGNVTKVLAGGTEEKIEGAVQAFIPTGTRIMVNLSTPSEAEKIAGRDVDGVGLLRAEFMVGQIGIHPKEAIATGKDEEFVNKLAEGVAAIARAFWPRPVIYRSFDFKTNEYRNLKGGEKYEPHENNPMIGYRGAVRAIMDREVFELELRMLKKVRDEMGLKNVWLMMPFVRTLEEVREIKKMLEEWGFLRDRDFKFLVMAEVPSVALLVDEFAEEVDGFSIGSNDLTQLVLGVDRDNETLAREFDERNEAVLRALEMIIRGAKKHGKYVSICGQAPSVYPEIVEFLVRCGIDSISVNPDVIERTRKLVAQAELKILLEKAREQIPNK